MDVFKHLDPFVVGNDVADDVFDVKRTRLSGFHLIGGCSLKNLFIQSVAHLSDSAFFVLIR